MSTRLESANEKSTRIVNRTFFRHVNKVQNTIACEIGNCELIAHPEIFHGPFARLLKVIRVGRTDHELERDKTAEESVSFFGRLLVRSGERIPRNLHST